MQDEYIGQRIKQVLFDKRMTGFELASKAMISEGGLSQIINGKIKNLKVDTALRIANALEVSLMWLISGVGTPEDTENVSLNSGNLQDYYQIPRYEVQFDPSLDSKVKFIEYKYDRLTSFHKSYFDKYGVSDASLCKSFKVQGDSMEPLIRNGDYVVVDCSSKNVIDGDIYAFCDTKGLHVKRLIVPLRGGLIIRSDNDSYQDEFLSKEEVCNLTIIGHVIDRAGSLMGA